MSVLSAFAHLPDPRIARTRRYPLTDLILLTLCGLLCGADNYVAIARFARARRLWLKDSLGIVALPSHDTLGRVMARLNSEALAAALSSWSAPLWDKDKQDGDVVAFDGKTIRGAAGNLNLLSAWASRSQMTLGLTQAGRAGGEQQALRFLLGLVDVSGCLVSADALHTQVETAQSIVAHQADYLLALKSNQGAAYESAVICFDLIRSGDKKAADSCVLGHKRGKVHEERRCWTSQDKGLIDPFGRWAGLKTVVCVERRTVCASETLSLQTRYFLSSATGSARQFVRATRLHWGIENSQHWRLDVAFREDASRVRGQQGACNLSTLRRMALSLLKRETSEKVGVATKRQMAGWDTEYLERVLAAGQNY